MNNITLKELLAASQKENSELKAENERLSSLVQLYSISVASYEKHKDDYINLKTITEKFLILAKDKLNIAEDNIADAFMKVISKAMAFYDFGKKLRNEKFSSKSESTQRIEEEMQKAVASAEKSITKDLSRLGVKLDNKNSSTPNTNACTHDCSCKNANNQNDNGDTANISENSDKESDADKSGGDTNPAAREKTVKVRAHYRSKPDKALRRKAIAEAVADKISKARLNFDLCEEEKRCPYCNGILEILNMTVKNVLGLLPSVFVKMLLQKITYVCNKCNVKFNNLNNDLNEDNDVNESTIKTTLLPKTLVQKSHFSDRLMSDFMVQRFLLGLSYERISDYCAWNGIYIPPGTISRMVNQYGARLQNVANLFHKAIRDHKGEAPCAIDETPAIFMLQQPEFKWLENYKNYKDLPFDQNNPIRRQGYLWTITRSTDYGILSFIYFSPHRRSNVATFMLGGRIFHGTFQSDRYSAYISFANKYSESVKRLGCGSHIRRKFFNIISSCITDPHIAKKFIDLINEIFNIERYIVINKLKDNEIISIRTIRVIPILDELQFLAESIIDLTPPKTKLYSAMKYLIDELPFMRNYVDIPSAKFDNNAIERQMRIISIFRKNAQKFGSLEAGRASANIMTIIHTGLLNNFDPREFLTFALNRAAYIKDIDDMLDLTPNDFLKEKQNQSNSIWKICNPTLISSMDQHFRFEANIITSSKPDSDLRKVILPF